MMYIVADDHGNYATGNYFMPEIAFRSLAHVYRVRLFARVQAWRRKHSGFLGDLTANWHVEEV